MPPAFAVRPPLTHADEAPPARSTPQQPDEPILTALGVVLLTFAVLGGFFLVGYVRNGFRFPIGWDAPYYVWRVNTVTFDGLARIGAIRAGAPLLLAVLMRATGQNALTMVAIVPAVFTGLAGLSAAAMANAPNRVKKRDKDRIRQTVRAQDRLEK